MNLKRGEKKNQLLPQVCIIPHATGERMGTGSNEGKREARRLTAGSGQHALPLQNEKTVLRKQC